LVFLFILFSFLSVVFNLFLSKKGKLLQQ